MYTIGHILRVLREEKGMPLCDAQKSSGIESTLLSRIETGKRLPTVEQVCRLAQIYQVDRKKLLIQRESDKILTSVGHLDIALEALKVAGEKLQLGDQYLRKCSDEIFGTSIKIGSRRYIGSKAKLSEWIMSIIEEETDNAGTFCDIFAGTGVISNIALKKYSKVIINDFLYSNNVIYKAFFGAGAWDRSVIDEYLSYYNSLDSDLLEDNYFSINFGGKYYDYGVAKSIGFIREHIELHKSELTEKEYSILLATLIYNIDKLANTVGHFEAYIKKPIKPQKLIMRPIDAATYDNVEIYRKDSNELAKSVNCDVVYIDPPYNSRQYGRFYHLYETLVKWDKPKLYGVALKPAPENMSRYCSNKAAEAFKDLVTNVSARYIVVSYNNTYNSKSSSSENKIGLDQLRDILEGIGKTKVFDKSYRYFNAGKTNLDDHKELIFVTRKYE